MVATVLVVNVAVVALLMLPLIPARALAGSPQAAVSPIPSETVGWPELVGTVADAYRLVPPEQRGSTVVLWRNYGEAGAVAVLGEGLPPAYSGQNSYADRGPPPESATTVVLGYDEATLRRWFTDVRPVARIDNAAGVPNDERGTPVWDRHGPPRHLGGPVAADDPPPGVTDVGRGHGRRCLAGARPSADRHSWSVRSVQRNSCFTKVDHEVMLLVHAPG